MRAARRFGAIALASVALTAAGCAPVAPQPRPAPSSSASSAPSPAPAAEPCPIDDPVAWGDVQAGAQLVDGRGEYCHVMLDPDSDASDIDITHMDRESIEQWGFTAAAPGAIDTTVRFVAEEVLDSAYLDSMAPDAAASWFATTPHHFNYDPSDSGVILTGKLPELVRDGGPRSESTEIVVERVYGQGGKTGPPTLVVNVRAQSLFRVAGGGVLPVATTYSLHFGSAGEINGHSWNYEIDEEG